MKNRFFGLALILMMSILLAACGTNSNGATGNNSAEAVVEAAAASPEAAEASEAAEAPAEAAELTIKHELGETTVKKNPQTVVVFDFGVLDSLDKLGVAVAGVPQANIPPYLSKYESADYANVGGLKEPDLEQISELQPDLILISGRQSDYYEELSKIGPTVFMGVDTERYMESYQENAKILGDIFGKETEVTTELDNVSASIQTLNDKVTAEGKNALIILANDGNISAYGSGSRFGIIHDVFGFKQADENIEATTHGQSVSFEYVAEKNPDYLFVIDRGAAVSTGEPASKELIENDLVKGTNAYKNGKIVYLDPSYWYLSGGGLLSVEAMVEEVSAAVE
ncbi:ABC transporter [Paenibacillus sp. PK3_47]|uniref:siderophore ABC transporter substrate-binding protein n=1 Tax=Paenibacillus sp. PK3_47 TaxID=2072642 RepID=UPI00201D7462|nr:siderophore ABC transporter substrate-binding protein [Paenibacillus sp. PK3_47]UQZ35639.1 ABC transporter [Paenibacillus sp. PK3_47]